ncbi:ABC-three component system middle component 6 [Yersinia intermedia]|uniref:ABC-three component system middle component 6 n=1 Tax=Yersinia intermedia TaxID=631 RepID=UPI001F5423E8|nr:ABC-three component system middle component 6 [Yersinia intermedia]
MMLLPKDIHPKDCLYYNGGFIIDVLKSFGEIELIELFCETVKTTEMSISIFILSLDWLFLIGIVELNSNGNLEYVHKISPDN